MGVDVAWAWARGGHRVGMAWMWRGHGMDVAWTDSKVVAQWWKSAGNKYLHDIMS